MVYLMQLIDYTDTHNYGDKQSIQNTVAIFAKSHSTEII